MIGATQNQILFSIIIPTYNRADFVCLAVKSLLQQDYPNFEVIVVDDGSTDKTRELLSEIGDPRLLYYFKTNAERGAARNFGAGLSRGDYINFFDSDDIALRNHLTTAKQQIIEKSLMVFHTGYQTVANGKVEKIIRHTGNLNPLIVRGNILSCNNVFIRRDVAMDNPFSEERALSGSEDWLLWLQLIAQYTIFGCGEVTASIVQHKGRSMQQANGTNTMLRANSLICHLKDDPRFQGIYGDHIPRIEGCVMMLAALDFAIEREIMASLKCLYKAVMTDFQLLFSRRFLAVIKNLVH